MIENIAESGKEYLPIIQQLRDNAEIKPPKSESFAETVNEFIGDVNSYQKDAEEVTEQMIKGEPVDLHDAMITMEKAKTSFQLLVEIRNKFADMYQSINRMQV